MSKVSCVYCIKHKLDVEWENIYIGSTCNYKKRMLKHKSVCYNEKNSCYNLKIYQYIRANDGLDNFEYIILEECVDIEKLKRLEQSYMDVLKPTLNCCNANGLNMENFKDYQKKYKKEYRENNKVKNKEYKKEYYEKNKVKINQKFNCECGGRFTICNKSQHLKTKKHQKYLQSCE